MSIISRNNGFTYKGYGRIYVDTPEDIDRVKSIIKEIDDYEFEHYMPKDLITTFDQYPRVVYLRKFDAISKDALVAICWSRGVKVLILDNGMRDDADDYVEMFNRRDKVT